MKESSDSDIPPLITSKGITNPLRSTVISPHFVERQCPYCESSSIVEKTSLCGSVPNYSPNIWTDSVLIRASPGHTKSPTNSSASNKTPVMAHKVQKEFVVEVHPSQQREERGIATPVLTNTTSPAHELYQQNDELLQQKYEIHLQNDEIHQQNHEIHTQNDEIHSQNDEIHQQSNEIHQQNDEIHKQNDEIHKQNNEIHSRNDEIHQQNNDQENDEVYEQNEMTFVLNVTECEKTARNQKSDQEVSTPVACEDKEEVVINELSLEEPDLNHNEPSEISFEATVGSLPSKQHAFPKSKSHSRSRSMDFQSQRLNPKKTAYSRHPSGKYYKEGDEPELSYAASLMEYATQKKLLKSSEASLDGSFSGAATQSDSLNPMRNSTLSSSDSRSVTPTGIPYSMDDPLYIHNSFKLYLDMKVFDDNEEFKLLLRVSHLFTHTIPYHTIFRDKIEKAHIIN